MTTPDPAILIPAAVAITPVKVDAQPEMPTTAVTDAEATEAAKELGMKFFSASKTRGLKRIGMFRAQQGVVHLGVGRLAACDDALQKLLDTAVKIAEAETEETKDRVGALLAGKALVDTIQNGIQMEADFQAEKLIGGLSGPRKRSFDITDQPIIPIQAQQVNINVDGPRLAGETKPV